MVIRLPMEYCKYLFEIEKFKSEASSNLIYNDFNESHN